MWSHPRFNGDNADNVIDAQNGTYGQAVRLIYEGARDRWLAAEAVLGQQTEEGKALSKVSWLSDHVVEELFELTSAIWRARCGLTDPQLPFADAMPDLMRDWLEWLRAFMKNCEPSLVRFIVRAVAFEKKATGQSAKRAAEAMLNELLALEAPIGRSGT